MSSLYESMIKAEKEGRPYALATIVRTIGCSPRSAATKMIVYADGSTEGTVGGGSAEALVKADALACIRSGNTLLKRYSPDMPGASKEDDCEKIIEVFIEPVKTQSHLYILGGGHVGQAVIPLAKQAGFAVTVIETRDISEYKNAFKDADGIIGTESYKDISAAGPAPGSYFIICTHSHATDGDALEGVLPHRPSYVGMLGAKHKFVPIFNKMREIGYTDEELMEIHAPIGLDIGGENLSEIAISVVAEMMAVKYGKTGGFMRDKRRADIFGV